MLRTIAAVLCLLGVVSASSSLAAVDKPVRINTGQLSGVAGRDPSITIYKGIPYAAPPLGALRWQPPQPPASWSGVRRADHFGPVCPSPRNIFPDQPTNEDCLTLNVWTGAKSASEQRPVFVWIFGGGFFMGAGSDPTYDGEALARKGVVVVTFNYRLGVLGFLATPELSLESGHGSGNYGLLDDIAVLKWVQRNIAAFGGDPHRVTIAGQSAGAGAAGFLEMSPLAKGLFQRSIKQTGVRYPKDPQLANLAPAWKALRDAETSGMRYATAHGARTLQELRAMPWQQLIIGSDASDKPGNPGGGGFRPVIDGWVLPYNYSETYARGAQTDSFVIAGGNRDEDGAVPASAFDLLRSGSRPLIGGPPTILNLQDYLDSARHTFGPMADEFLKLYPASTDREASLAYSHAARDNARVSGYLWATLWRQKTSKPVYLYQWSHAPPGPQQDINGAYHGSELYYMFGNLLPGEANWTADDRRIADLMTSYWANFVKSGNPNGTGLPQWPAFKPGITMLMELGDNFGPIPLADDARMEFWKRFFQAQVAR